MLLPPVDIENQENIFRKINESRKELDITSLKYQVEEETEVCGTQKWKK